MLYVLYLLEYVYDYSYKSTYETRRSLHSTRDSSSSLMRPTHEAKARRGPAELSITHQVKSTIGTTRTGISYHTWLHQALSPSPTLAKHL